MSKFGAPCWEWGETGCVSGWGGGGGTVSGGSPSGYFNFQPPFNGYQGGQGNVNTNGTQTTVVNTHQVNTLLNANANPKDSTNAVTQPAILQMDIFQQIKTLIMDNKMIALGGAALLVYLLIKKN